MPIAAAAVAVLAALATMMSNSRATQAIITKNQAILSFTRASDTYNYYQAKAIKEDVYRSALMVPGVNAKSAQSVVDHEHTSKAAILAKAQSLEKQAEDEDALSERYVRSYETLEKGVAFFEVGVVVFSISSLVTTLALPALAAVATIVGIGFSLAGLPL
jgi:hypothetical protein